MKRLERSLTMLVGMALCVGTVTAATFKKYEVKSGKVTYRISGSSDIRGMTQTLRGKKRLIFDQYGFRELTEEATVMTTEVMGQKQVSKSHRIEFRDGTKVTVADYATRSCMTMEAPGLALMVKAAKNNLTQMGEEFLKGLGGRKVGSKSIAGYRCDVWVLKGMKECLYKGVPLEVETKMGPILRKEIAVKAEFDIPVSASDYKLPDFPKQELPPQAQAMMEAMAGMGEAVAQSGGASLPAGGGERGAFETLKAQSLQQLGLMRELNACLKKSATAREANICGRSFSQKAGTPFEPIERWNDGLKREATQNLEEILQVESCIRAAKTMDEFSRCNE